MIIPDLNILIYAVNSDSPHHEKARKWIEEQFSNHEPVGIPWIVILGFLRIMTNSKIFRKPLTPEEAVELVDSWLKVPCVSIPEPRSGHWSVMKELINDAGTAGNLTSDIHLAACAVEYGATLYSLDADFSRFRGLRWKRPF